MGQNFIAWDREQELLLPPSLREWLYEDHLAWFVISGSPFRNRLAAQAPVEHNGTVGSMHPGTRTFPRERPLAPLVRGESRAGTAATIANDALRRAQRSQQLDDVVVVEEGATAIHATRRR